MRRNATDGESGLSSRVHGNKEGASFQVIVLGASGGPREDNVSGLLVRAPQSEWRKGSVIAVDAGVHLASIVRILQQHMPLFSKERPPPGFSQVIAEGPFAGVRCPGISARANALHIFRELMHAFLITHPHLDHLSAMGVNTPALEYGREAKTILALDSTIEAIKSHIFNDSIWPNLSDEGSGVGFVTYRRLKEGGNNRLGSGDARGYVRICENLATLCMAVTHGKCKAKPVSPHHRSESIGWHDAYAFPQRRLSRISDHESYFAAVHGHASQSSALAHLPSVPTTPAYPTLHTPNLGVLEADNFEPVKSSAFFILNEETNNEVLIFGDIEPDAVSSSPQNYKVWRTAASKVANGTLKAIFIECSYEDSVRDSDLYGHLCPRHLIQELLFLAREVAECKAAKALTRVPMFTSGAEQRRATDSLGPAEVTKKRKRVNGSVEPDIPQSPSTTGYVGTRSSSSRRKTSTSTSAVAGDVSPMALRAQSPSRIPQATKHVHFSGHSPSGPPRIRTGSLSSQPLTAASPTNSTRPASHSLNAALHQSAIAEDSNAFEKPHDSLSNLTVHIIHVKDTLTDGPGPGEIILEQLAERADEIGLQCGFHTTEFGESIWV
ncbi:3',5'-cyclic-nucleotide phosphodiesterase pde1 [Lithohypha guttulata]|nr:3',5'-cyclic-nucleotide phosphodiesterase pde1 [Lithohypha guttulata]